MKLLTPPRAHALIERLEDRRLLSAVPQFTQTNLVSDGFTTAQHTDPNLLNSWGIVVTKPGVVWVADAGAGVSTIYDTAGNASSLVVTIPLPGGAAGASAPTGIVLNHGKTFAVSSGAASGGSTYLFATEDGTISGWNQNVDATHAIIAVDRSASGAVYKGLAIAGKGKHAQLYATNFHAGIVEVYDRNFAPVTTPGGFADPNIPAGFAPFNIQNV